MRRDDLVSYIEVIVVVGLLCTVCVIILYNIDGPIYTATVISENSYQGNHGVSYYNLTLSIGPQYPLLTNVNVTCSYYHVGSTILLQEYRWNMSHSWNPQFHFTVGQPLPAGC